MLTGGWELSAFTPAELAERWPTCADESDPTRVPARMMEMWGGGGRMGGVRGGPGRGRQRGGDRAGGRRVRQRRQRGGAVGKADRAAGAVAGSTVRGAAADGVAQGAEGVRRTEKEMAGGEGASRPRGERQGLGGGQNSECVPRGAGQCAGDGASRRHQSVQKGPRASQGGGKASKRGGRAGRGAVGRGIVGRLCGGHGTGHGEASVRDRGMADCRDVVARACKPSHCDLGGATSAGSARCAVQRGGPRCDGRGSGEVAGVPAAGRGGRSDDGGVI